MEYIAFDSHKRYTLAAVARPDGQIVREERIVHERGAWREFLGRGEPGAPVAVETIGNWYWIVDEIEAAGCVPRLVHARKAKLMMGQVNKTDKLDARGLNVLQRTGTLPMVWIPPGDLRDRRDVPRTRMVLVRQRTQLKNRIHAILAKYAVACPEVSDIFGVRGRQGLQQILSTLPPHTAFAAAHLLDQLAAAEAHVRAFEARLREVFAPTAEITRLRTLPGVGLVLAVVIAVEVGDVTRFASAEKLAAYAGTTPRVHARGGRVRYGALRPDANRYLRWAFVEAANTICLHRTRHPEWHVSRLYARLAARKGHHKAVGAVARHLAEATYWMLRTGETYREPVQARRASVGDERGWGMSAGRSELDCAIPRDDHHAARTAKI
jgi:transposase